MKLIKVTHMQKFSRESFSPIHQYVPFFLDDGLKFTSPLVRSSFVQKEGLLVNLLISLTRLNNP